MSSVPFCPFVELYASGSMIRPRCGELPAACAVSFRAFLAAFFSFGVNRAFFFCSLLLLCSLPIFRVLAVDRKLSFKHSSFAGLLRPVKALALVERAVPEGLEWQALAKRLRGARED